MRTSLIPGLLRVFQSNQNERIPQKIFEISDCAKIDPTSDTGCVNFRKICIMQLNTQASFEVIHGALCQLMTKIGATLNKDFYLKPHGDGGDAKFFPQRGADVYLSGQNIGSIGVLHPEVLDNF